MALYAMGERVMVLHERVLGTVADRCWSNSDGGSWVYDIACNNGEVVPRVFERYLRLPDGSRPGRDLIQDPATTIRVLREQLAEARRERDEALAARPPAIVGTASGAKQWTPEQFAEWLRSMGCPESEVPGVTEWFNRHSPVVPIEVQAKEPP